MSVFGHYADDSNHNSSIEDILGDMIEWMNNGKASALFKNNEKKESPSPFRFIKSSKAVAFKVEEQDECLEYQRSNLGDRAKFNWSKKWEFNQIPASI